MHGLPGRRTGRIFFAPQRPSPRKDQTRLAQGQERRHGIRTLQSRKSSPGAAALPAHAGRGGKKLEGPEPLRHDRARAQTVLCQSFAPHLANRHGQGHHCLKGWAGYRLYFRERWRGDLSRPAVQPWCGFRAVFPWPCPAGRDDWMAVRRGAGTLWSRSLQRAGHAVQVPLDRPCPPNPHLGSGLQAMILKKQGLPDMCGPCWLEKIAACINAGQSKAFREADKKIKK